MPIHLVCECGARVIAPTKRAGQSIRCPKCDARINVPADATNGSTITATPRALRLESAISDLVSARRGEPHPPQRPERIDPPQTQDKFRPTRPSPVPSKAPSNAPAPVSAPSSAVVLPTVIAEKPHRVDFDSLRVLTEDAREKVEPALPARETGTAVLAPLGEALRPRPSAKPILVEKVLRAQQAEKSWLGAIYGLALLWGLLGLIGLAVGGAESYFYYQREELLRMERWALLVSAASVVELALAIYLAQLADWIACRAAAAVISCIAAIEAMVLAVTLFSSRDGSVARFLDLTPHLQSGRALGVALLLTLLSVLLAYVTGSVSLAWEREEERKKLKRVGA